MVKMLGKKSTPTIYKKTGIQKTKKRWSSLISAPIDNHRPALRVRVEFDIATALGHRDDLSSTSIDRDDDAPNSLGRRGRGENPLVGRYATAVG